MFSISPRRFHSFLIAPMLLPLLFLGRTGGTPNDWQALLDATYTVHGTLYGSFPFNQPIRLVSTGQVSHGTLRTFGSFNGFSQDSFIYLPDDGYVGPDSFTYHACDSSGNCEDGTVSLDIVNNAPHAVNDSYSVHRILYGGGDTPLTANDSDPDSDPIRIVSVTPASHGRFNYFFSTDSFIYEPNPGFTGTDTATYKLCDSLGLCDTGTIIFNVVNHPPVAAPDSYTTRVNESFSTFGPTALVANDSDPDNDSFSVTAYTAPSFGALTFSSSDGTFNYEPNQDFVGEDSFSYTICDDLGACATGKATINVEGSPPTPTPTPTPIATPTPTPPPPPPPSPTPTPTPTEPLIFIPGIAGSYLVDTTNGAELWPGILTNHDPLSLDPADFPNPNVAATDAIRRVLTKNYYGPLLEMLTGRGGYHEYQVSNNSSRRTTAGCDLNQKSNDQSLNPSLFVFAYDWRKSNVENASKLKDYVGCVQQFYPDSKVNILAHSMGSLLARRFILDNPGKVKKLITIAGAWLGAPKSIYTMLTGNADFSFLLVWKSTLRRLSEFFPSIHELFPSGSYYEIGERPFAESGDFNRNGVSDEVYTYDQQIALLNGRYPRSLPGSENLAFHGFPGQDNWNGDSTGVEYHQILGIQHTNQTIGRVIAQRVTVCVPIRDELNCFDREVFTSNVTNGDRTVPERSATRISSDFKRNLNANGARLWYYFSLSDASDESVEHTALTQLTQVHNRVLFILGKGPDPGEGDTTVRLRSPSNSDRTKTLKLASSVPGDIDSIVSTDQMHGLASETTRLNHSRLHRSPTSPRLYEGTNILAALPQEPQKAEAYYLKVMGVDFVSITDAQGNTNTRIDDTFALPVPNVTYNLIGEKTVFLSTPADKAYTINFQVGSEPINLEIVKGVDNLTPTQAVRYRDVQLPANVNAMMKFGPTGIENLRYDADGDGVFESSVTPTAALSGTGAADVTAPSISIGGAPQQTVVQVTITAQDSGSGVKSVYYSLDQTHYQPYSRPFVVDPSHVNTVSAFADDNAANRSAMSTYAVPRLPTITTPPDLTLSTDTSGTSCGVTISDETLGNVIASSNSSGTVTTTRAGVPPNNLFPVSTTSVVYTATDSDGLIATATQKVTVLDKTPPTISCRTNVSVTIPENSGAVSMAVSYPAPTATDNCSIGAVNIAPISGAVFPVGTTSVTATATDAAGNSSSCSFTVSVLYRFTGFFPPAANLPTLNSVNAGRAIPVKFSLSGNKGVNIFAAPPGSASIGCDSSSEVELTDTVAAGNSSLSYDPSGDQYIYVWKTDASWAGTCRQLVIQLNDGMVHRANFKFK